MCFNVTFGDFVITYCTNGSSIVVTDVWSSRQSSLCNKSPENSVLGDVPDIDANAVRLRSTSPLKL